MRLGLERPGPVGLGFGEVLRGGARGTGAGDFGLGGRDFGWLWRSGASGAARFMESAVVSGSAFFLAAWAPDRIAVFE